MPGISDLTQWVSAYTVWLFVAMLALLCIWETRAPCRKLLLSTPRRWLSHLCLYFAADLPLRLLGIGPLGVALARRHASGLLSSPEIPWPAKFLAVLLLLDLLNYARHRLCHTLPWLWRIHLLHHSDHDFDFSNQLRFHPLDAGLQLSTSMLLIWFLAPPPLAVAVSIALATISGMLAHANVEFPQGVERFLRWVFITPGLHQIHHSIDEGEQERNLGVLFVFWDRMFGTYLEAPAHGYAALRFGVNEVDAAECIRPLHMIFAPFCKYTPSRSEPLATAREELGVREAQPKAY